MKLAYLLSLYFIFILTQLTHGSAEIDESLASCDKAPDQLAVMSEKSSILHGGRIRIPEEGDPLVPIRGGTDLGIKTKLRSEKGSKVLSGCATPLASPWLSVATTPYTTPAPQDAWRSPSNGHLYAVKEINSFVQRQVVEHIGYMGRNVPKGKGVVCVDADEVLFCTRYIRSSDAEILIRLYHPLEDLLKTIRSAGHKLYILTYNKAVTIREKLKLIGLEEGLFDKIVAAEMAGDVMTAKGNLFRGIISEAEERPDYAVFIDNFPTFVEDVERVATELELPLYSYVAVGYKGHYKKLVYYRLQKLAQRLEAGEDITSDRERIKKGLEKYEISLEKFTESYPSFNDFLKAIEGKNLIWPYCTYM